MLTATRRRQLGAFYTPSDVAQRLTEIALDGSGAHALVCDPACGDGAFLVAAALVLAARGGDRAAIAREQLWGADIDASAVAGARAAIIEVCGADPGDHLVVSDGLALGERWPARFDAVVGNPPFLNQLERATVRSGDLPSELAAVAGPYTDTACLFLVAAQSLVRDSGRVVLVQPQSLLAARDATAVRAALTPDLEGLWSCDDRLFDADVRVCAPVLRRAGAARLRRWVGRAVEPADDVDPPGGGTWSSLLPTTVPPVALSPGGGVLGDLADATAGFRDQFYGLAPHVADERDGDRPLLVTSGLIDIGRIAWGERSARFAGARYTHPRVDVDALPPSLRRWVDDRLRPKVVVATQTKVLEAAVDGAGAWVPSTPVLSVEPRVSDDVWRAGAVLCAPPVSAWAARTFAGAALAADTIKLSAKQVRAIPLPANAAAWCAGAEALRDGDVDACATAMNRAYAVGDDVLAWWFARR